MWAGFSAVACTPPPDPAAGIPLEWLAPKVLARRADAIVPIYDPDNPPMFALSSSVGLSGRWSTGAPLDVTRAERRGDRILVWAKLPPEDTQWLEFGQRRWALEVWPRLHELPEIAALPKDEFPRRAALEELLAGHAATSRLGIAARMELARSYQRQNRGPEARAAWVAVADVARHSNFPSLVTHGLRSAAYVAYFIERDYPAALALLDQTESLDQEIHFQAGQLRTRFQRGMVAEDLGQYREAAREFRAGVWEARAAGLDRDAAFLLKGLGAVLQDQGLHDQALSVMEEVESTFLGSHDPRDRVWYLNDLAWLLVRGMAAGALPGEPERIRRVSAKAIAEAEAIGAAEELASLHANLAWLELLLERRTEARAELERGRSAQQGAPGFAGVFMELLEARLDLEEGKYEAARQRGLRIEARTRAESQGRPTDLGWRALEVSALAADRLGRSKEASELYARAISALEEISGRVGLLEARGPYFADRRSLLDNAVNHWLARGQTARAFSLTDQHLGALYRAFHQSARREQPELEITRRFAQLDTVRARQRQLELELELAAPKSRPSLLAEIQHLKSEVLRLGSELGFGSRPSDGAPSLVSALRFDEALALFVSGGTGPRGFLVDRPGEALRITAIPGPEVALSLEKRVAHLYVVAGDVPGALRLAAQATPAGAPLLSQVSISYLPYASALLAERPVVASSRPPLLVVNPTGDLPEAGREGRALLSRFADATLLVGAQATKSRVLEELRDRSLFHFAGHGSLDGPWRAHLNLAGDRLEAIDVLVARAKIGLVVLNGCETGVPAILGPTQAVALPELWWIAGAQAVLSTVRSVGDAEARRFVEAFYDQGGAKDPIQAYRRVALSMIAQQEDAWQAFRVVGLR
ncbi:MAG: CHAT domain-containing protein [Deltaproteobacteria bacterium]|nr:CHAT domain-containing protein [Deltaproteobacteria bacterium]